MKKKAFCLFVSNVVSKCWKTDYTVFLFVWLCLANAQLILVLSIFFFVSPLHFFVCLIGVNVFVMVFVLNFFQNAFVLSRIV